MGGGEEGGEATWKQRLETFRDVPTEMGGRAVRGPSTSGGSQLLLVPTPWWPFSVPQHRNDRTLDGVSDDGGALEVDSLCLLPVSGETRHRLEEASM